MKSRYRTSARCLLALGTLAVLGCSEDNNQQFLKEQGGNTKAATATPDPGQMSYEEYGKQAAKNVPSNYPGAAKANPGGASTTKAEPAKK